jgi:hypothetical protein
MRALDPFGYFFDHASAIAGHGGESSSPDPRYCFHTHYEAVRSGPAQFRLALGGVRASTGELTARVHAYRPGGLSDVLLVAGSRLDFAGRSNEDLSLEVRFRAVRDVHYALYGYFSEPSDLAVASVAVMLEELDEEGGGAPFEENIAVSALAAGAVGTSASQASALVFGRTASLEVPVSQDCTLRQLRSREFDVAARGHSDDGDVLRLWSEIACRQALTAYGAALPGLRGLVVGGTSRLLSAFSEQHSMALHASDWHPEHGLDALAADGYVDFLLSFLDIAAIHGPEARYDTLVGILSRLLVGGLGMVCFRYAPDAALPSTAAAREVRELTRNEIGQWVLRLIGAGFSAAPLAFAPVAELACDEAGHAAIVLVLRRL